MGKTSATVPVDLVPALIWRTDRLGRLVYCNRALSEFTGMPRVQANRLRWQRFLHPDEAEATVMAVRRYLARREPFRLEFRLRRSDGEWRWMACSAVPHGAATGEPDGFVGSCMDVTELKLAEERRRSETDERQAVMQELHHRVKNNAQVFASLLSVQASRATEPAVKAALRSAAARAATMAFAQQQIWDAGSSARFDLVALVRRLIRALPTLTVEVAVEAPPALFTPLSTAVPLGLIVHELLTNAVRHAYPAGAPGLVRLSLARDGEALVLRVADYGAGLPGELDPAASPSAGLTIVRSLARQLAATMAVSREDGTAVTLRFACPPV